MQTLREFSFVCQRPASSSDIEFERKSRVIMSSISKFLGLRVKTKNFWKININVNSANKLQHKKVVGGVLKYNIEYNIEKFCLFDLRHQKTEMLKLVSETLYKIFSEVGLSESILQGISDYVEANEFKMTFTGKKNTLKNTEAVVLCEQGFEVAEIFLLITGGINKKIPILSVPPEEFIFHSYLNKPSWLNEKKVELMSSNGDLFSVSI